MSICSSRSIALPSSFRARGTRSFYRIRRRISPSGDGGREPVGSAGDPAPAVQKLHTCKHSPLLIPFSQQDVHQMALTRTSAATRRTARFAVEQLEDRAVPPVDLSVTK